MERTMNNPKIPETDSIQQLAHFWDTHDLTDFENELEEVSNPVFERAPVMKIRLLPDEAEAVKQLAKSKGIPYPDLIREWVREKIQVQ